MQIINPATEKLIKEISEDTEEQVHEKFLAAQKSFAAFRKTSFQKRAKIIQTFGELLQKKRTQLAEILTKEMGKPISQSLNEIEAAAERIDFFLKYTEKEMQTHVVQKSADPSAVEPSTADSIEEKISYEPLGVIANISAWNYPYFTGINVFVPAILCGNCVLYKPSEYSSLTGLEIARLFIDAGLPSHVFQTVLGAGRTAQALVRQKIDSICFTGSYRTGKKILSQLRERIIRIQLELGGKDPAYVHSDVDIGNAASSLASGAFYNNGQSCCAVERLYVHEKIYDSFVSAFTEIVKKFHLGDPLQKETFFGPLARKEQIANLTEQVEDAFKKGAVPVLEGGVQKGTQKNIGYYFHPVILTNTNHEMKIMKEESFGPVIGIQKVKNETEALELMQDTEYGLTAAVYTKEKVLAETMLSHISAGTAYWNVCDRVSPYLPWSGQKHSGIGSTLSWEGIHAFLKTKAWHCRPSKFI